MPLWLACVLLLADLAALVYFRRHLRQKKTMRVIATCVCGLLATLLLLEEQDEPLGDAEQKLVQTVAGFLGRQMES